MNGHRLLRMGQGREESYRFASDLNSEIEQHFMPLRRASSKQYLKRSVGIGAANPLNRQPFFRQRKLQTIPLGFAKGTEAALLQVAAEFASVAHG